jgi:dipeptidyl aminopeptidase/acylaminoacyl peptidase
MRKSIIGLFCFCLITVAHADDGPLKSDPTAKLFGSHPDIRGVRLSPDGNKLSMLKTHPDGYTIAAVLNLQQPKFIAILNSKKDVNEIPWCQWANNERLLCAFNTQIKNTSFLSRGDYLTVTRLMAVNEDATEPKLLMEEQLGDTRQDQFSQIQSNIIDWLPEDPDNVLIQTAKMGGTGVGILNIHTGRYLTKERIRDRVFSWISDGQGNPRLYNRMLGTQSIWNLLQPGKLINEELRKIDITDMDDIFIPQGFGDDKDELLYFARHEGRMALYGMNLTNENRNSRLIYSNPRVDISSVDRMGKYNRLVSALYAEEKVQYDYFDKDIKRIYDMLKGAHPNDNIVIVDEDWNRRFYLVVISSDINPGIYYRFDSHENKLVRIGPMYSSLKDVRLSKMETINYPARDGTPIPAYLSLPASGEKTGLPAIIMPHGGPSSRDVWGFDFLAQYLTAKGYAVLQTNYRGSDGYGKEWLGDGAFKRWRLAIDDITDGAKYLINEGIADEKRICIMGWSFGGYAALMSGIQEPDLYQCIVSIAGVSDPQKIGWDSSRFVGGAAATSFIGHDKDVIRQGAPVYRAADIQVPVLLFHAKKDINVPIDQSDIMHEALETNGKSVEYITYEHAEHNIFPERYRVDMLTRIGEFLDKHNK